MNSLGDEQKAAWEAIVNKCHTQQAIWWLNGFWRELEKEADNMWKMVHDMIEIECGKEKRYGKLKWEEKEGCDLDQFQSHRFLEKQGETCTVKELRAKVKNLDVDRNKRLALSEYLADKFNKSVEDIIDAPQGGQAAQEQLDRAIAKVNNAVSEMKKASDSEEAANAKNDEAAKDKKASDDSKAESQEAVAEVESQEAARALKITKFEKKIQNKDGRLSAMKINTAKAELAAVQSEDPLPLRKAKLTQKAALKKSKKAAKKAAKTQKLCEQALEVAAKAREDAAAACDEAKEALTELKEKGDGIAHGQVWWLEKELFEREKFMPRKKKK